MSPRPEQELRPRLHAPPRRLARRAGTAAAIDAVSPSHAKRFTSQGPRRQKTIGLGVEVGGGGGVGSRGGGLGVRRRPASRVLPRPWRRRRRRSGSRASRGPTAPVPAPYSHLGGGLDLLFRRSLGLRPRYGLFARPRVRRPSWTHSRPRPGPTDLGPLRPTPAWVPGARAARPVPEAENLSARKRPPLRLSSAYVQKGSLTSSVCFEMS